MPAHRPRNASVVLAAASGVLLIALEVRTTFGLLMQPVGLDMGFTRETFSLAFAIRSLVWGLGAPLFGAMSDGVWLGGWSSERTGSYDLVWWLGIGLGLGAAALSWPIDVRPVAARTAQARS